MCFFLSSISFFRFSSSSLSCSISKAKSSFFSPYREAPSIQSYAVILEIISLISVIIAFSFSNLFNPSFNFSPNCHATLLGWRN